MNEHKKDSQLYSQTQISKKMKVSQATVTRLLKKNGVEPVKIKGRSKLYSQQQIERLNLSILRKKANKPINVDKSDLSVFLRKEIERLHDENDKSQNQYESQLAAKDKQINDLNDRLKESHQLQLGLEQKLQMLPDSSQKPVLDGLEVSPDNDTPRKEERSGKPRGPKKAKSRRWWSIFVD